MSPLQRAVQILGSQAALAEKIGKKQQHVQYWLKKRVPAEYAIPIEKATGGAIKRHELRPDVYPIERPSK